MAVAQLERSDLIPLTRGSGNEPVNTTRIRPRGCRGGRGDGKYRLPAWWPRRLPTGWRPADRTEALAAFDAFEAVAGRLWLRKTRERRRELFRIWVLVFMDTSTGVMTASNDQLVEAYRRAHGVTLDERFLQRFRAELRNHGFALVVECASGVARTGSRAASYVILVSRHSAPSDTRSTGREPLSGSESVTSTNTQNGYPGRAVKKEDPLRASRGNFSPPGGGEGARLWITPLPGRDSWRKRYQVVDQLVSQSRPTSDGNPGKERLDHTGAVVEAEPPPSLGISQVSRYRLTWALRRFFDAGWTGRAIARAIDWAPNGERHQAGPEFRSRDAIAVIVYRLALHRGVDGSYLPPAGWVHTGEQLERAAADDRRREAAIDAWIARRQAERPPTTVPAGSTGRPPEWFELRRKLAQRPRRKW